jgi:hypothetical protein
VASVTGVRHAVSTHPVRRPGPGCPAVGCPARPVSSPSGVQPLRCPVTRVRRPGPAIHPGCCPPVQCPALCCPPVRCPAVRCPPVRCPALCCPPHPSGRVRLLPPPAVALGPGRCGGATVTTATGRGPYGLPRRRRLGRRPSSPGGGRRRRGRAVASRGSVTDPGRLWAGGGGRACPLRGEVARPAGGAPGGRRRCGQGSRPRRELAAPAAWLPSSGWWATTVGGSPGGGPAGWPPLGVQAGMRCGPSAAQAGSGRSRLAAGSSVTCGIGWWACQDLNLGPHPYQGSAPGPVCAGSRLPPARTTYRWRPLETVANRSAPMGCGPNVDQA